MFKMSERVSYEALKIYNTHMYSILNLVLQYHIINEFSMQFAN